MCKGFSPGESAGIANSKYVQLLTVNKFTTDIDTATISLDAEFPACEVVLGSSLKTQFSAYSSIYVSSWEVREFAYFVYRPIRVIKAKPKVEIDKKNRIDEVFTIFCLFSYNLKKLL